MCLIVYNVDRLTVSLIQLLFAHSCSSVETMVISLELLQVQDIHHCKFLMISSTQSRDRKFFVLIFQYTFTGSVHESTMGK